MHIVAESRSGNSKPQYEVQLDDIEEAFRYVFDRGYVVRMKAMDGSLAAPYSKKGRNIIKMSETCESVEMIRAMSVDVLEWRWSCYPGRAKAEGRLGALHTGGTPIRR